MKNIYICGMEKTFIVSPLHQAAALGSLMKQFPHIRAAVRAAREYEKEEAEKIYRDG